MWAHPRMTMSLARLTLHARRRLSKNLLNRWAAPRGRAPQRCYETSRRDQRGFIGVGDRLFEPQIRRFSVCRARLDEATGFFRRYQGMVAKVQAAGHLNAEPIISRFADDCEMGEVIRFFIDDLQWRVNELGSALDAGDWKRVSMSAHELNGAAGGYGFPEITEAAAALEKQLDVTPRDITLIRDFTHALIALCERAIVGSADHDTVGNRSSGQAPQDALRTQP
jgi:HPt (histidine-containing phosphotransfer) domain-containing protein